MRIDRDVAAEVIERLQPLGIEAALAAQAARGRANEDKRGQVELALEQARYEVGRARRQYDAVDPDNRLVAAELEKRWNDRLAVVRNLETELEGLTASPTVDLTPADRERLMTLGADLERAWSSAGVAPETRKRIVRTLIDEIVVRVEDNALDLVIRWHGGDHSALKVKKNRSGQHRWSAAGETVDLVRVLARQMPDKAIASVLNRSGKTHGARQWLDQLASVQLAQPQRHRSLSRRRAPRPRRGHSGRGCRGPLRQPINRATSDQGRPARGEPALQRGTLDHQSSRS